MHMFTLRKTNPDILMCLANLSSDEVFTPPKTANDMLDLLPQELFRSPETKFLDPACKSGVFLREIVKRLIIGLEDKIPDLQERVNHIMSNQVYGIAVTELTAMISRRTVYCSMNVKSRFSVCKFNDDEGRIRFRKIQHTYGADGHCRFCGTRKREDEGEENHAYEFIHTVRPEEIWDMKFDVIISNPPYQIGDGGFGASAKPLYQLFVEQAKKLDPKYIVMIIPARWYAGGKGLDDFRESMLNDGHIRVIHDYPEASECFDGVQIKGGVCYFLRERDNSGDCRVINHRGENISEMTRPLNEKGVHVFIRYNEAIPILRKVRAFRERSFAPFVSPRKPFGLDTVFHGEKKKTSPDMLKCYENGGISYVSRNLVRQNEEWIKEWKVYVPALGSGSDAFPHMIIGKPFIGEPNTICTETYLLIGPLANKQQADNIISYMSTKFFRFLVLLMKNTQHATSKVYSLVPYVPEYAQQKWTDADLYAKYSLTPDEIAFIDSMIRPMNLKEDSAS